MTHIHKHTHTHTHTLSLSLIIIQFTGQISYFVGQVVTDILYTYYYSNTLMHRQTQEQFHFVNSNSTQFIFINSNSTSNLSIPIPNVSIPIPFLPTPFTYYFLPWVSTYLEYLCWVVYIPSRIIMEEIFLNLNGKLICGFNFFVGNFNSNSKFINSNSTFF